MTSPTPCPEPASWKRLLDDASPETDQAVLSAHLETCEKCQQTLEGLAAGSAAWAGVARHLCQEQPEPGPAFRAVLAAATGQPGGAETQAEPGADGAGPLDFLEPPDDPHHLGRLGPYEVVEVVGRGGMGVVFKALDPALRRVVALKVLTPELATLPSARQRFLREARAAAAISHEHVVTVHAVDEAGRLPYLVMQYVPGSSLQQRLDAGEALPVAEVVRIGRETAAGLAAAHARGLVHRDVKPANILLEAGTGRVKLTDFGLARAVDDASITGSGVVAGTPYYMAPEQARGEPVDHRADLFSLGSVLYAMCTGRPPFEGTTALAVLRRVSDDTPPPVREVNGAVPPWLAAIIARLHAKDPALRFQSAAEVADVLDRNLAQLLQQPTVVAEAVPVEAVAAPAVPPQRPPQGPPRGRQARPRRRLLLALAACLVLAAVGVAAFRLGPALFRGQTAPESPGAQETAPDTAAAPAVPAPPVPAPPVAVAVSDREGLAGRARQTLATYCYRCHGENGTVEGGFNYLLDRDRLVARNKVRPGQPGKSRLLRLIAEGDMPPEGEKPRPGKDEIALLERWVTEGAPAFGPSPALRAFVSPAQVAQSIRDDLEKRPDRDRRFTRYFTLTHLYDAGLAEDELQTYRNGLSKLLNSLSWRKKVAVPVPVDPARTVLRIDLRDYGWTDREWEALAAVYPYATDDHSPAQEYAAKATDTTLAQLRGDWFVATASRPPLYHQLLQLPDDERGLEKLLHIDVEADIQGERVARAGFNDSGVSRNNRLIERHETSYGAYWKTYDFAANDGEQNLFERPLGPGSDGRSFRHAGSEIIFNLPNGLQGYMLVNGKGARLDRGPTEIVSDPRRPDRAVENGLSCMSCHPRGINPKADQVRGHVKANPNAFADKEERDTILALYPEAEVFSDLQRQDTERFRQAAAATGAQVGVTEPVRALAEQFEAPLDLRRAAAEVGLHPDEFLARLGQSPEIGRAIGELRLPGGTVSRQTFVRLFPQMAGEWDIGAPVAPAEQQGTLLPLGGNAPLPPYMVGADAVVVEPDGLQLKSDSQVRTRDGDFLTKDFVFDAVFSVTPRDGAMVAGLGDASNWNKRTGIQLRLHRPPAPGGTSDLDLMRGEVRLSRPGIQEEPMGHLPRFGTYLLRFEKQGKALTISILAEDKGGFKEVMKRSIPDVEAFDPTLNDHNAFLFVGNSFKLKQVRLKVTSAPVPLPETPAAAGQQGSSGRTYKEIRLTEQEKDPAPSRPSRGRAPVEYRPYVPKAEKEEVALSGAADDVAVGGGGRYLILRLAGKKKLAVFDVQQGKVARELPLAEEGALFAAGATQLAVVYPEAKLIKLWNLYTREPERSAPLPATLTGEPIHQVCMGSASPGPLFAHLKGQKRTLALDLNSLQTTEVHWTHWSPTNAYGPLNMRAAPSGNLLVGWGGGWAGLDVATFRDGRQIGNHDKIPFSGGAFALPNADGRRIFSASAIVDRTFSSLKMPAVRHPYMVPAVEPGYFLALQGTRELPLYGMGRLSLPGVDEVAVYTEDGQRLFNLTDLDELKAGSDLPWEKRVHYYPGAGLLVSLGAAKDRLLLRRVDLLGRLEKSGADYLVVLSRPPLARAGKPFSYRLDIRSRKGGVKVKLESGPKGLKVTPDGRVSWDVPAQPDEAADVLLTLSDATGQEVFHTFTIEVLTEPQKAAGEKRDPPGPPGGPGGGPGRAPTSNVPAVPAPKVADKVEVKFPEPFAQVRTGGAGRYLIFHLKKAKKLAVFDVSQAKVVHEIDAPADDVLYAAGLDKLLVAVPGQRLLQRWDLRTGRREKTVPIPGDGAVLSALMGCNSRGPLLLFTGGRYVPWDVEQMKPAEMDDGGLGGDPRWDFQGRVSADGQTVTVWHAGLSPQQYGLGHLRRPKNTFARSPDGHSFNGHWAMPNADGSLVFRFGGGIYDGDMKVLGAEAFKGLVLLPTEDPRFFLAVQEESRDTNAVLICTSADRQVVFTVKGVEKMTGSSLNSNWGHFRGEPRVHYLPSAGVLVNLPESNDRVVVRPLNLIEALNRSGQDYLFVLSRPDPQVAAGATFTYRMDVQSKAGGLRYTLEAGPKGMTVSRAGVVRWQAPERPEGGPARVIITVRSASGKEVQHAFDLTVVEPSPH